MSVNVIETSAVERKLEFSIPGDVVKAELDKAYRGLAREARFKGFRKGKVPRKLLEARFARQIEGEVSTRLISDAYDQAIKENELEPVSQPSVDNRGALKANAEYTFSVVVEVKPSLVIDGWQGVEVPWEKVEISDEQVEERIEARRQASATIEPVEEERGVADTDLPEISYTLKAEGKEDFVREGYLYSLAQDPYHSFLKDLVLGLAKGAETTGTVTVGDDFIEEEWRGVEAEATVSVTELKALVLPEMDDDFAVDLGYDDLETMKGTIRFEMQQAEEKGARERAADRAIEALLAANEIPAPEGLVRTYARDQLRLTALQMAQRGMRMNPDLDAIPEEHRNKMLEDAGRAVRRSLLLEAIARSEELEVTAHDLDARYEELAQQTHQPKAQVKGIIEKNRQVDDVRASILEDKALDRILEAATVVDYVAPAEDEAPAEDAEESAASDD